MIETPQAREREKVRCFGLHTSRGSKASRFVQFRTPLFPEPTSKCSGQAICCCPSCFSAQEIGKRWKHVLESRRLSRAHTFLWDKMRDEN